MDTRLLAPRNSMAFQQPDGLQKSQQTPQHLQIEVKLDKPTWIRKKTIQILDSHYFTTLTTILTFYALFGDDIRLLFFTLQQDDVFFSLSSFTLFVFTLQILVSFLVKPHYRWSFYFWLDLISTISIIPDIGWLWVLITEQDSSDTKQIQNAGKASRAGARASRIIRVIRLVRLIRIAKLYKNAKQVWKVEDTPQIEIPQESKISHKFSTLTTQRVIVLILTLLLILPMFNLQFYDDEIQPTSWDYGLQLVMEYSGSENFQVVKDQYIQFHQDSDFPIIYLSYEIDDITYTDDIGDDPDDLRLSQKYIATDDDALAIFDLRKEVQFEAWLNMIKTVFVCIVLLLGIMFFINDANILVLLPIENMIEKVKLIAKNPVRSQPEENFFDFAQQFTKESWFARCCHSSKDQPQYETKVLEDTIVKIGSLLALGFGEAGGRIIASNLERSGDINPLLQGKKIIAIFGFCDIRNFTDTTEQLKEGVLLFVNEIAKIVHSLVDKNFGAANKNIGDAFLLVWKFNQEDIVKSGETVMFKPESIKAKFLADMALLSFVEIYIRINKDPAMLKYRHMEQLTSRMLNYSVKMGFGLHLGYGIQGPIGSQYKIDPSYLSPHVNIASRLEAATKQYGVPILISGSVHSSLSKQVQQYTRLLDNVTVKGSSVPIRLFTCDLDLSIATESRTELPTKAMNKRYRRTLQKKLTSKQIKSWYLFYNVVHKYKESLDQDFFSMFKQGVHFYLDGEWAKAKEVLEEALVRVQDGPCQALLQFMAETDFKCPSDWEGFRVLTEKQ